MARQGQQRGVGGPRLSKGRHTRCLALFRPGVQVFRPRPAHTCLGAWGPARPSPTRAGTCFPPTAGKRLFTDAKGSGQALWARVGKTFSVPCGKRPPAFLLLRFLLTRARDVLPVGQAGLGQGIPGGILLVPALSPVPLPRSLGAARACVSVAAPGWVRVCSPAGRA